VFVGVFANEPAFNVVRVALRHLPPVRSAVRLGPWCEALGSPFYGPLSSTPWRGPQGGASGPSTTDGGERRRLPGVEGASGPARLVLSSATPQTSPPPPHPRPPHQTNPTPPSATPPPPPPPDPPPHPPPIFTPSAHNNFVVSPGG